MCRVYPNWRILFGVICTFTLSCFVCVAEESSVQIQENGTKSRIVTIPSPADLRGDIKSRLQTLRTFVPAKHYVISFQWLQGNQTIAGVLEGQTQTTEHWIRIQLEDQNKTTLRFDKFHLEQSFKGSKVLTPEQGLEPIISESGVCYFMIAMPFLSWEPGVIEKTAKRGRHVFKVILQAPATNSHIHHVLLYVDENFNMISEAYAYDSQQNCLASFLLQSFKRYDNDTWYLKSVRFTCGPHSTQMNVLRWQTLED